MQRVRVNLTPYVAFCIYNVMIKSQMTHCSSVLLGLSRHWVEKLECVQKKAKIICGSQKAEEWSTIADTIKRNAMMIYHLPSTDSVPAVECYQVCKTPICPLF